MHLVSGHADGRVLMWDTGGDNLRPVLLVEHKAGKAVKAVGVCEDLGLLAVGHANGKVRRGGGTVGQRYDTASEAL
jgi:hypothetical protein